MAMDRSSRPMHRGRKRFAASALIASTALITRITCAFHQRARYHGSDALRERLIRASGIQHKIRAARFGGLLDFCL